MSKNIKYAVWSAVSKDHQAKPDKVSLGEQVAQAHQRAGERGWQPTNLEYIVPGESRTLYVNLRDAENEIPELKAMLDDAQAGKFNLLILYDYNRLRDLIDPVAKTLSAYGVQLYSVSQPADPIDPENYSAYASDSESIVRGMSQIISRSQISDIQRKNAYAMPKRITERGLPHRVPYGYIHVKNGPPLVDPEKAKAVILIKDMMLSGNSLRQTCDALMEAGYAAPLGGKTWYAQTVQDIISNPFYAGEVAWLRTKVHRDPRTGKRTTQDTPGRVIQGKGAHVPLWTAEEHERLAIVAARRDYTYIGRRAGLFSGLLTCGTCGSPMRSYNTPRVPGRQYVILERGSYCCRKGGVYCSAIKHVDLFNQVTAHLRESLENARAEPVNAGDILEHLNAEIAKRDRLTEAYLAGAYQLDEYLRHKSPLDETIKRAEKQHRNIEDTIRRQAAQTEQSRYILDNWDDFIESLRDEENMQASNHALRAVIARIVVKPDGVGIELV
jgi:hypothetical protein